MSTAYATEIQPEESLNPRPLPDSLRGLIDARLDTIERMLLGRVPRPDRLAIVRDVEGQIHEMLAGRALSDSSEPDRDTVLAVLADLDPPEAYLPEDGPGAAIGHGRLPVRLVPASALSRSRRSPALAAASAPKAQMGLWGGILGIIAVLGGFILSPLVYLLGAIFGSDLLLLIGLPCAIIFTMITAGLAIVFSSLSRLCRPMAITGLACGLIGLILSLLGAAVLIFLVMRML